jgi:hypothetical protein
MNEITGDGIPVLIPPDSSRRANKPKRPGRDGGAYDFMRSVLSTELGSELYRQRAQLIEPIFGNTKHNRGFTRFHRRADPPPEPNGASWPPRTTCSASTSTSPPPPDRPRRPKPPAADRYSQPAGPFRDSVRQKEQRFVGAPVRRRSTQLHGTR